MTIHNEKHLKGEGVYFTSQLEEYGNGILGALQLQQGIREMLVLLCSPFFLLLLDSVQALSVFRGSSLLGSFQKISH